MMHVFRDKACQHAGLTLDLLGLEPSPLNNSRTKTSAVSHWIGHSLACIIRHWLNLILKPCTQGQLYRSD